jgi:hypothetical protein
MELNYLLDHGFTLIESNKLKKYTLSVKGFSIIVSVGDRAYSTPATATSNAYEAVEVAFVNNGNFLRPLNLPAGFPMWDGCVFRFVPVVNLYSLLHTYCTI